MFASDDPTLNCVGCHRCLTTIQPNPSIVILIDAAYPKSSLADNRLTIMIRVHDTSRSGAEDAVRTAGSSLIRELGRRPRNFCDIP